MRVWLKVSGRFVCFRYKSRLCRASAEVLIKSMSKHIRKNGIPVSLGSSGWRDSKSRSRVATMPFSLWNLTAKQRCIRNLPGFPSLSLFPNCPTQWTTFRKNLVSLVSLLLSIVQFGRERNGDVPVDSNATIPGPCWHRLRQCGRCTSKWHSRP
jgi:hypothetical protein